jgi:hypothetical protein
MLTAARAASLGSKIGERYVPSKGTFVGWLLALQEQGRKKSRSFRCFFSSFFRRFSSSLRRFSPE